MDAYFLQGEVMAFVQFKLDRSFSQTRYIFNEYVYETEDTIAETLVTDYFIESRFFKADPSLWIGSFITCKG